MIRSDTQYILFPMSTDILACQVSNGQFCHINSLLYFLQLHPFPSKQRYDK